MSTKNRAVFIPALACPWPRSGDAHERTHTRLRAFCCEWCRDLWMEQVRAEGKRLMPVAERLREEGEHQAADDLFDVLLPEFCAKCKKPLPKGRRNPTQGASALFCTNTCRKLWDKACKSDRRERGGLFALSGQLASEGKGVAAEEILDVLLTNDKGNREWAKTFGGDPDPVAPSR